MINKCNMIRDILPLYIENMASDDTRSYVKEHLETCKDCAAALQALSKPNQIDQEFSAHSLERHKEITAIKTVKKKLRKRIIIAAVAAFFSLFIVMGLVKYFSPVSIEYGESQLYTQQDMDAAIQLITGEFNTWHGCKLYSIRYANDGLCKRELEYCNSLSKNGAVFIECIIFNTRFRSPLLGGGNWHNNSVYDYTWYLARTAGGDWQLLTWGVG